MSTPNNDFAGAAVSFVKKNPWVLFVIIGTPVVLIALVVVLIFGIAFGISSLYVPTAAGCVDPAVVSEENNLPPEIRDLASNVETCAPAIGDGTWVRPGEGRLSDYFGPRAPICGNGGCTGGFHSGIDLASPNGSPVLAASSGTIVRASYWGSCGNTMEVDHGGGILTRYCHLQNGGMLKNVGDTVSTGEQIGIVGNTGVGTAPHLHFTLVLNGALSDPLPFMKERGVDLLDQGTCCGA